MKFAIGIESINYFESQINEVISDEDSLVNDNITHLQFQDYNSAFESVNTEIEIMLKGYEVQGTEADNTQKKNIFVRLWEALLKMFSTLGKWISDGFKWVLKKIGIGGENNPDTVNANNVESAAEVASEIITELKSNDKKDEVSNETNVSKEDIVVEESKLDELIDKAVKKVYSKPQFKNSKSIRHIIQDQYKKIIRTTAIALRDGKSDAELLMINVAKFAKNEIEIPVAYFNDEVLERFKKQGFEKYSVFSSGSVQESLQEMMNSENKRTILNAMTDISYFIIGSIYLNAVMVNTILDFDIDVDLLKNLKVTSSLSNLTPDKISTAKSYALALIGALNGYGVNTKEFHHRTKTTTYKLELHRYVTSDGLKYNLPKKDVINSITNDKRFRNNALLFTMLKKCSDDILSGFQYVEEAFKSEKLKNIYYSVNTDDKFTDIEKKKHVALARSLMVDAKEIAKLSVKFLAKAKPFIEYNDKNIDSLERLKKMSDNMRNNEGGN